MILIKIAFFFKVLLDWWIELMHLNFLKLVAIWKILFRDVRTKVYNDAKLYKHDGLVIYVTCVLAGNNSYCTGPWVYKLREDNMSISLFFEAYIWSNFSKNKSTFYSPFQTWLYNSDFCRILPLNHYIFSMLGTLSKRGLLFIGLISLWGKYVFKLFYRAVIKWDFSKSWVLSKGRQINFFFLKWDLKT